MEKRSKDVSLRRERKNGTAGRRASGGSGGDRQPKPCTGIKKEGTKKNSKRIFTGVWRGGEEAAAAEAQQRLAIGKGRKM